MKLRILASALLVTALAVPAAVALVPSGSPDFDLPANGMMAGTTPPSPEDDPDSVQVADADGRGALPQAVEPGGDRVTPPPGEEPPAPLAPAVETGGEEDAPSLAPSGEDAVTTTYIPVVIEEPTTTITTTTTAPPPAKTTAAALPGRGGLNIPMVWTAISGPILESDGTDVFYHRFYGDLKISWPYTYNHDHARGSAVTTLLFPLPLSWATAEAEWRDPRRNWGTQRKVMLVTGYPLPDLNLHSVGGGNNRAVWEDYLAAHPPVWIDASGTDWSRPACDPRAHWTCRSGMPPTLAYRDEWHASPATPAWRSPPPITTTTTTTLPPITTTTTTASSVIRWVPYNERDVIVNWWSYQGTGTRYDRSIIFAYVADPDGPAPQDCVEHHFATNRRGGYINLGFSYTKAGKEGSTDASLVMHTSYDYCSRMSSIFPYRAIYPVDGAVYNPAEVSVVSHAFRSVTLNQVDPPSGRCFQFIQGSWSHFYRSECDQHHGAARARWGGGATGSWGRGIQANAPALATTTTTTATSAG